jgi:hypothetical protein
MNLLSIRNSRKAFGKNILTAVPEERQVWNLLSAWNSRKALGKPVLAAETEERKSYIF